MENYSNSQFSPFIWKRVHSGFSESWIYEWEMPYQHPTLILRYSQPYAWLHQKGPHDHLPSSWGRDLVWYILKCIVCHIGIRKHSLCITTVSCDPAPPFSSSSTPPLGQQSSDAVASCVAWHPDTLGNPPYMQRCPPPRLPTPTPSCLGKGEKRACMPRNQLSVLLHSVWESF